MTSLSEESDVVATLQAMGYSKEHIVRAVTVHSKTKQGTDFDISLLVEIIARLKAKDDAKARELTAFDPFFQSIQDVLCLKADDVIDYRFENGRYILCKVVHIDATSKVAELHPLGEPDSVTKHNRTCSIYTEYRHRKLAKPRSISLRVLKDSGHSLFGTAVDDYIDVNPMAQHGHYGWRHGRVIKADSRSSQMKVLYYDEKERTNCSFWFHLESADEVAAFKTKCEGPPDAHIVSKRRRAESQSATHSRSLRPLLESLEVHHDSHSVHRRRRKQSHRRRDSAPKHDEQQHGQHTAHSNVPSFCSNSLLSWQAVNGTRSSSQRTSLRVPSSTTSTVSEHNSDYQVLDTPIFASSRRGVVQPLSSRKKAKSSSSAASTASNSTIWSGLKSIDSNVSNQWDDKRIAIVHQLAAFGYDAKDIVRAMDAVNDAHDINQVIECIAARSGQSHHQRRQKGRKSKSAKSRSTKSKSSKRSETPDDETSADDEEEEDEDESKSADAMYHSFFFQNDDGGDCGNDTVVEHPSPTHFAMSALNRWMRAQQKVHESSPTPTLPDTPMDVAADPLELGGVDGNVLVFGMEPLSLSSQVLEDADYGAPIPVILVKLKETLFSKNGHLIEGIFRIRSHSADCKLIADRLHDADVHSANFSKIHSVLIANLIELWFDKLPHRVLEDVDVDRMKAVVNMQAAGRMIQDEIGEPFESYFKWLLDLCVDLTRFEKDNKMSIKNCAEVLAPALFGPFKRDERARITKFVQLSILWRHFAAK